MDKTKGYFDRMEESDYTKFLSVLGNQFSELERTSKGDSVDAYGTTLDGTKVSIELKSRNQSLINSGTAVSGKTSNGSSYSATTLWIETSKFSNLVLDFLSDSVQRVPLYVNLLEDGSAIVFNLSSFQEKPVIEHQRSFNPGLHRYEYSTKINLPLSAATIVQSVGAS